MHGDIYRRFEREIEKLLIKNVFMYDVYRFVNGEFSISYFLWCRRHDVDLFGCLSRIFRGVIN